ncbi:Hsp33 family molecular chaperone HslO [Pusillimonas sp. MFBS29]|uniref:Hsp33 family molecular chaperone HslO n=1 Tax=Pusillimonas sp. MFBS29 TaxID=2886690 RepID=UPI001D10EE68|nr:Hsp33 family molecular chaperone HslO [Pusillimonas sp. MFBS29]MCC2595190.1 Hsp33 family molecular chaperone HslO [Pusillimonas sp. MFBS29]
MTDELKKYLLSDHSTRIQAVRLSQAWKTGMAHQHYPACVETLLGELVAASILLTSNIKFDGALVLQLHGDGPIALIVVECTTELSIRATVTVREDHEIPADGTLQTLLNTGGTGRFVVTLDPGSKNADLKPYQGIIPLEGDTVAQVLERYMQDSEQLDTRLWLGSDTEHAAGLLLQRLPAHGGHESTTPEQQKESWDRVGHLASTLKQEELLTLDIDTLIKRLFWEEELLIFEPQSVRWYCPCSRERVAGMLQSLGREEIESILHERRKIDILCNFCGKPYEFDAVDCAGLFVSSPGMTHDTDGGIH